MEPKRTKYDTNPLDGKVAEGAKQSFESRPGPPTAEVRGGPTRDIARTENESARAHPESEAPTQRIDGQAVTSYPSVFIPPKVRTTTDYRPPAPSPDMNIYQPPTVPPASVYQPPPQPVSFGYKSRTVQGLGISEKWANILPYIPGHIGAVAGVVELLLVPRTEARARFHAAQGLALQAAILILAGAFSFLTMISGNRFGSGVFGAASTIFLIVSIIRVWKGKPHHIAPLDEFSKWLDEKIKPRK
ncbi:MAG: hypothetical protein QOH41_2982 [Blastocatellia bacterium]|jgi:uncharacterized membrane protein|nr:hypothetical protein [Blastocatellia bacterium]